MKDNLCPVCLRKNVKVSMRESMALENTLTCGASDIFDCGDSSNDGVTVSKTGKTLLVTCQKCPACGHSIRKSNSFWARIFGA